MSGERYLIVQCCHLPQFFFITEKLREENPDATFDALLIDHPQARFYAGLFPVFRGVYFSSETDKLGSYDAVVLPLMTRGYPQLKKIAARRRLGPLFQVGYSGELRRVGRIRLLLSVFHTTEKPNQDFAAYLERFPHRAGYERVLLIESCHESLVPKAKVELSKVMREHPEVIRVRKAPLRDLLRRFQGQEFDTACVFFSGERGFLGMKLLPFLLRIPRIVILNENRHSFEASWGKLARFLFKRILYGTRMPFPLPPRIVLFQTETVSYLRQAARRLKQRRLFPHSELIVVCRPEDQAETEAIPEVNRVFCYPHRRGVRSYYQLWRKLNRLQPDLVCGIFSGRSAYRWEKILFFCLEATQHLAFNATLDCYQVSVTRLFWMFRNEPLVFDEQLLGLAGRGNYILLLQTADDRRMLRAITNLRDPRIVNPAPIAVFCTEAKRSFFQEIPGVRAVYTYQPKKRWEALRAALKLRKLRFDVMAAVVTGESFPRIHKLLFMVLPARNRLVFRPDFRAVYLSRMNPFSLLKAYRREAILLIQTADDAATLRALEQVRDPRITRPAPLVVFCREDKGEMFARAPGVDEVVAYHADKRLKAVKTLVKLLKFDITVVTALFTGEPIFHLQKLLFFVVPASNRLVFNHNLDCYYLNRSTFWSLFHSEERLGQLSSSRLVTRLLGKALLFLPRFLFLVIWVTGQKLKRAYSLSSEVR